MKKTLLTLVLAVFTAGLFCSCSKEDPTVAVTGVTLDKTELTMTVGGSDVKLTATVAPKDATDKSVTWSSDKAEVATVDQGGNVTAVAEGTANITVTTTDGGKKATCVVTVKAAVVSVESVSLDKTELAMTVGDEDITLTATVAPDGATDKSVTWSSDKTEIATVDQEGKVHAVAEGTATITVTTTDGSKTATCVVTVSEAGYVEIGGLKWATKNLGATSIAGSLATCAGDYYAWGETETYYNSIDWVEGTYEIEGVEVPYYGTLSLKDKYPGGYSVSTYCRSDSIDEWPRPYEWPTPPYGDDKILKDEYDVVKQKVGDGWRMPTADDFKALVEACTPANPTADSIGDAFNNSKGIYLATKEQTVLPKYAGVEGILFIDAEGHQLFFPSVSTCMYKYNIDLRGETGSWRRPFLYWTSNFYTPAEDDDEFLKYGEQAVAFLWDEVLECEAVERYQGFPIRPVKD